MQAFSIGRLLQAAGAKPKAMMTSSVLTSNATVES